MYLNLIYVALLLLSSSRLSFLLYLNHIYVAYMYLDSLVVHTMDTAESSLNAKGKGSKKVVGSNPRAKPTNWPSAISEFLLDWYIEKKLVMPPKTSFKRLHHTACTSAINSNYGTTYSVDQVHRHWRRHRDTWGLVAKYLNESGGGFDSEQKLFTLSKSTMDNLTVFICCLNDPNICTYRI